MTLVKCYGNFVFSKYVRVAWMYRLRNAELRRIISVKTMSDRVDEKVLKLFGHVDRTSRERLTK